MLVLIVHGALIRVPEIFVGPGQIKLGIAMLTATTGWAIIIIPICCPTAHCRKESR